MGTLVDVLVTRAAETPDLLVHTYLPETGAETLTYRELYDRAAGLAGTVAATGGPPAASSSAAGRRRW